MELLLEVALIIAAFFLGYALGLGDGITKSINK